MKYLCKLFLKSISLNGKDKLRGSTHGDNIHGESEVRRAQRRAKDKEHEQRMHKQNYFCRINGKILQ